MGTTPARTASVVRLGVIGLVLLAVPGAVVGQAPAGGWVGKRVVGRSRDFAVKDDAGKSLRKSREYLYTFVVIRAEGTRLRLRAEPPASREGWARASEVIPLDQAPA